MTETTSPELDKALKILANLPQPKSTSALDFYLPQLPEGWALHQLQERWLGGISWYAAIYRPVASGLSFSAEGKSPREAILKCLDKRDAHYEQD